MAQLIVLLEKDFKNTLKISPRSYISNDINLHHVKIEIIKRECYLNRFKEDPDNDSNVVNILPEDIIDTDSASNNGSHFSEVKLNYTNLKNTWNVHGTYDKANKTINCISNDTQIQDKMDQYKIQKKIINRKVRKDESNTERDRFGTSDVDSEFEVSDNKDIKRYTNNKETNQNTNKLSKNDKNKEIKQEINSNTDLDLSECNSGYFENDPDFEDSSSKKGQRKNKNTKRKSVNTLKKNGQKIKVTEENRSDSEYNPDRESESEVSDGEVSDWRAERSSPNKKYKKGQSKVDKDYDPNKTIIRELLDNSAFFACTVCHVEVKTYKEKEAHKKSHNLRYLSFRTGFRCPDCALEFGHSTRFRLHYEKVHSNTGLFFESFKCTECAYKAESKKIWKRHMTRHKEKGTFQCEYCSFSHDHKKNLTVHLRLHKKFLTGIYYCNECSYSTKHDSSLYKHKKIIHLPDEQKKWIYCQECPFKTVEIGSLRKHIKRHQLQDGYQCPHCTYSSPYACRITDHIKVHYARGEPIPEYNPKLQTPLHSCPKCSYKTMTKTHLDRHMTAHQTHQNRRKECAECPFTCKDKIDLVSHVKCHNGEGNLKCPWCSFTHRAVQMMTKHKRLHNDDRESKLLKKKLRKGVPRCPICNELFQAPSYVKRHMKKHQTIDEIENPFMCAHCPYRAKNKEYSFIAHIQCHFRTDGIKCDFCSFRHDRQNVMTIHLRLHNEMKIKTEEESKD